MPDPSAGPGRAGALVLGRFGLATFDGTTFGAAEQWQEPGARAKGTLRDIGITESLNTFVVAGGGAFAFDRATGRELWRHKIAGASIVVRDRAGFVRCVVTKMGYDGFVAHDAGGKELWIDNDDKASYNGPWRLNGDLIAYGRTGNLVIRRASGEVLFDGLIGSAAQFIQHANVDSEASSAEAVTATDDLRPNERFHVSATIGKGSNPDTQHYLVEMRDGRVQPPVAVPRREPYSPRHRSLAVRCGDRLFHTRGSDPRTLPRMSGPGKGAVQISPGSPQVLDLVETTLDGTVIGETTVCGVGPYLYEHEGFLMPWPTRDGGIHLLVFTETEVVEFGPE